MLFDSHEHSLTHKLMIILRKFDQDLFGMPQKASPCCLGWWFQFIFIIFLSILQLGWWHPLTCILFGLGSKHQWACASSAISWQTRWLDHCWNIWFFDSLIFFDYFDSAELVLRYAPLRRELALWANLNSSHSSVLPCRWMRSCTRRRWGSRWSRWSRNPLVDSTCWPNLLTLGGFLLVVYHMNSYGNHMEICTGLCGALHGDLGSWWSIVSWEASPLTSWV